MSDEPPWGNPFEPPSPFKPSGPFQPPDAFQAPGEPPAPPALATEKPAPPPPELRRPGSDTPMGQYLWRRLEGLEGELASSREAAAQAQGLLRQQGELKGQVEAQLKLLSEQLRREKTAKDIEEEKTRAHGRVDALEKRLDEMHGTWAGLLREAIGTREGSAEALALELRKVRADLAALAQDIAGVPQVLPQLHELKAQIPAGTARWEEDARRLEALLAARLDEIERRAAVELERQRDRLADLARERSAFENALEAQRQQLHQEFLKERTSLLNQFQEQSAKLHEALEKVLAEREGEGGQIRALREVVARYERMLAEPAHAKDEIVRQLESEQRELLNALKQKEALFAASTRERREVEQSLGETVLRLQRELEEARARHVGLESRVADLQMQAQAAQAAEALARRDGEVTGERFAALAAERDELAKALMSEAGKVRDHVRGLAEADRGWEEKVRQSAQAAAEERQKRISLEAAIADLRGQIQTLSNHLARALQERDQVLHESAAWREEKERLGAALRKKDEMISMLSSTFKNLLNK